MTNMQKSIERAILRDDIVTCFNNFGMLTHNSGAIATFGMCDGCDSEKYLTSGSCLAQDYGVNSICQVCEIRHIKTGFYSTIEIPSYRTFMKENAIA